MNIFFSFAFNFILFLTFFFFFFVLTFLIHRIGYLIYDIFFAVSFPVSPLKYIYIYPFHTRFTFTLSVSFQSLFNRFKHLSIPYFSPYSHSSLWFLGSLSLSIEISSTISFHLARSLGVLLFLRSIVIDLSREDQVVAEQNPGAYREVEDSRTTWQARSRAIGSMTSLDRRSRSSKASRYLSGHFVTIIISVVSSRSFLFSPGAVPRVPSRAKRTSKKKVAEDSLSENLSAMKHRRSSSFEEWIPIFNISGSFLANFILYIYIYYKNVCTIYIYIVYRLYYIISSKTFS